MTSTSGQPLAGGSATPAGGSAGGSGHHHVVEEGPSLLLLDSNIRDWVVLPLLVIMIAAGMLRQYIGVMLRTKSNKLHKHEIQGKGVLQRASRLRSGAGAYLTHEKWEARRRYFIDFLPSEIKRMEDEKAAEEKAKEEANAEQGADAMSDFNPMGAMMDGVKGNMVFMIQNMVMMQGISYFFQGFVLLKVPFPLTNGFKQMFQRGLDLSTLDTSYVSSVSWYFLVMFGLRAFFRLAMGDMPQETQEGMTTQMNLGSSCNAPNPQAKFDPSKALKAEVEALEITQRRQFTSTIDDVERRLLGKKYYPKKKTEIPATGDIYGLAEFTSTSSTSQSAAKSRSKENKKTK